MLSINALYAVFFCSLTDVFVKWTTTPFYAYRIYVTFLPAFSLSYWASATEHMLMMQSALSTIEKGVLSKYLLAKSLVMKRTRISLFTNFLKFYYNSKVLVININFCLILWGKLSLVVAALM